MSHRQPVLAGHVVAHVSIPGYIEPVVPHQKDTEQLTQRGGILPPFAFSGFLKLISKTTAYDSFFKCEPDQRTGFSG